MGMYFQNFRSNKLSGSQKAIWYYTVSYMCKILVIGLFALNRTGVRIKKFQNELFIVKRLPSGQLITFGVDEISKFRFKRYQRGISKKITNIDHDILRTDF